MTDATTITTLRQQRDDAWAECDRLRDRLADYERDLLDDVRQDRSQDTDYLRAGFLQRGAEIERIEAERDDHEQARTALEETLAQTAAELREYRRATIKRDESVPEWAWWWTKDLDTGPLWAGFVHCKHNAAKAPDLRPDDPGPITLPIVDVE